MLARLRPVTYREPSGSVVESAIQSFYKSPRKKRVTKIVTPIGGVVVKVFRLTLSFNRHGRKKVRMDPQVTWERLLDAYADDDRDGTVEHATALLDWLEKGGFPPRTVSHRRLRPAADRLIALATCRLALGSDHEGGTT